jgi:Ca2+-binding EF-hand superfamily protein
MEHRAMMGSLVMRIIFALIDSDSDGTISKIFKAMDANKDGRLTLEEMLAFMHGTGRSVPQQ